MKLWKYSSYNSQASGDVNRKHTASVCAVSQLWDKTGAQFVLAYICLHFGKLAALKDCRISYQPFPLAVHPWMCYWMTFILKKLKNTIILKQLLQLEGDFWGNFKANVCFFLLAMYFIFNEIFAKCIITLNLKVCLSYMRMFRTQRRNRSCAAECSSQALWI